ncbi:MAG TPA: hypothetical protein VG269_10905 [Tepidisphaeraceae bacterium]|nr:hypothetical protein [Tepidisphaeraceae bacterium]
MSSVSSVSGAGQGLYQFIQSLSAAGSSQAAAATSPTDPTSASAASSSGQAVQGSGHHHHGGGGKFKQIEDAVTSALQAAQSSGTSQDPNQIIESAISKVLQNTGSAAPATGSATQAPGTDPDGDGSSATGSTSAATPPGGNSFLQALQTLGVSPQQFHSDFLAAIKDAQGGNPNPATAFQSFPPGTTIDTIG